MVNGNQVSLKFGVSGGGLITGESGREILQNLKDIAQAVENSGATRLKFSIDTKGIEDAGNVIQKNVRAFSLTNVANESKKAMSAATAEMTRAKIATQNVKTEGAKLVVQKQAEAAAHKNNAAAIQEEIAKLRLQKAVASSSSGSVNLNSQAVANVSYSNISNTVSELTNTKAATTELTNAFSKLALAKTAFDRAPTKSNLDAYNAQKTVINDITKKIQENQSAQELAAKKSVAAIKSEVNAHLQYNNILDQAKDYYEKYSTSIQKNAQLNAKWQEYLNNMQNAPETYGSQTGARSAMSDLTRQTREAGLQVETLRDKLGRLFGIHVSTMLTMLGIHALMQSVTQVYQNVLELNDSLTQLQIVTKNTSEQMSEYFESASKSAEKLGVSISDLTDSATTFARLGYSTSESSTLSEMTAMLTKVGDVDTETATNAITSIAKSFHLNVSDISKSMDEMVEIGNNFPISVSQLSEGVTNAGSMLATAGNSLEQTMALLTSANTTVQDIGKASTGLRTIAARIRNTKTELDGLGESMTTAEYGDLVSALTNAGVKLTDVNGEFRSTYDILKDIASVSKNLTSMQQAGLAEALAGTRQQNVYASIVGQFQEAEGAMGAAADSAGKMSDAYNIWLDSISGYLGKIQATFQSLSGDVLSSGLANFVLSIANGILQVVDGLAKTKTLFPAILVAITSIKSAAKPNDGFINVAAVA